ncbi:hypothetical protein L3X38_013022 [Prunus dulcis]|uniref:Uncharacterized protein n=1 Tax=Prunus dulcis TaxID=3755 RepID=A0AAD4ZGL0_PRUDU|nr:hypothetical protein L3X38_013022 [Prunus dulcis]
MESREQHHSVYPTGFAVGRPSNKVSKWHQKKRKTKNKRLTQGFISSMPWHTIFAFLNPLLIGILQVKCQGATKSPFDTHQEVMWTFLLATLVYCFAFAANMKSRRDCSTVYSRISGHFALLTGSLSSVSLFSIFLPRFPNEQLVILLWIIMPLIVARKWICRVCQKLCKSTSKATHFLVHCICRGFFGRNLMEQPQLPV